MTFNDTGLIINEEISSVDENGNGKNMHVSVLIKASSYFYSACS